jgi:hypothetical protein
MGPVTSRDVDANHPRNWGDEAQTAQGLSIEPVRHRHAQHGRPEISLRVGIAKQSDCKSLAHILSALHYYLERLRQLPEGPRDFPELLRGENRAACGLAITMTFEENAELCRNLPPNAFSERKVTRVTRNGVVLTKHVVALSIHAPAYSGPICELVRIAEAFPQLHRLRLDLNNWYCRREYRCDTLYSVVGCESATWTPFLRHVWLGFHRTDWDSDDQFLALVRALLWSLNSRRLPAFGPVSRPSLLLDLRVARILKAPPCTRAVYPAAQWRPVGDQRNWLRRWRADRERRSYLEGVGSSPSWCLEPGHDCVVWVLDYETQTVGVGDEVVHRYDFEGRWTDPLFEPAVAFRGHRFTERDWYALQPHETDVPCGSER